MVRRLLQLTPVLGLSLLALSRGAAAQSAPPARVQTGIEYAAPGGYELLLDAYLPPGSGPFPAVVLVHGGGWEHGDRTNLTSVAQYLAANGFAAFSIDYRRANPTGAHYFPYPAAVDDVRTAIRWVRSHAPRFDVDPKRMALLGSSAGAHLASLVGMMGKGPLDAGDRVRAVVSWSGPQEMAEVYRDGPLRAKEAIEAFTDCHGGEAGCAAIFKEVSPITYVDPSDPALFFANGTRELVPLPQAHEMDAALSRVGVPHRLVEVPGRLHAQHYENQTVPSLPAGQTVLQASLAWLNQWVNRTNPGAVSPERPADGNGGIVTTAVVTAAAGALALFLGVAAVMALRRRSVRARRIREWKEGQTRHRRRGGLRLGLRRRRRSGRRRGARSAPRSRSRSGSSASRHD